MEEKEIFDLVKKALQDHVFYEKTEAIYPETDFKNDLGLDSLDQLVLMVNVEKKLGIFISDDMIYQNVKVQDLVVRIGDALKKDAE